MRGNLILGRTAVPRATPQFEAQLLANLIQAGRHRVCTPAGARPRVLAASMSPCTGLGCPRRGFPAVGAACAPTHRSLQCLCIACLSPAAGLQRICSLGTMPLSCVPRCSQERPAPTLHFRRRRLQVWLHRCCNQGVRRINNPALPQPAGSESSWLIAASFHLAVSARTRMYKSPLHGIQGSETLSASSARRRGMMLFCPQSQQQFFASFAQRPGKAPLRRPCQR